eukprot:15020554-Heterocapsa_arctica.AAC.1
MELDQEVFGAIAALKGAAWLAGGDWNRTPEMIAESRSTEPVGGFIAPGERHGGDVCPRKRSAQSAGFLHPGPGHQAGDHQGGSSPGCKHSHS